MTTEERIKLAKEALDSGSYDKETIEYIFPELKESEDERIRRAVKNALILKTSCNSLTHDGVMLGDAIAWLEKQKAFDTTPADWNDYKDKPVEVWNAYIHGKAVGIEIGKKQNEQKPAEWSEEDVRNIQDIDSVLFYDKNLPEDTCIRLRNWVKSLKERYTWKPSEEQMEALKLAYEDVFEVPESCVPHLPLKSLYNDLKQL